jgi:hypothetical protein
MRICRLLSPHKTLAKPLSAPPEFSPGPLPGGDVRGFAGCMMPVLILVLLIVGLIAIPFLKKKFC